MERSIFFANIPFNIIENTFGFVADILKSEEKNKFDRVIGVGKFLEQYYPGSHELFLFLTEYK